MKSVKGKIKEGILFLIFIVGVSFLMLSANYRSAAASEQNSKTFVIDNFFLTLPSDNENGSFNSYPDNNKRVCLMKSLIFYKIGTALLFIYLLYILYKLILWGVKRNQAKSSHKHVAKGGLYMGHWFKENWFKLGILASFLIASFSVAYYFILFLPAQQITTMKTAPNNAAEIMELENKCFKAAQQFFDDNGFDPKNSGFKNHYNRKLNKCFIDVKSAEVDDSGRLAFRKALYDVYSRKMYGEYYWKPEKGKNYWEVKPNACLMLDRSCQVIEEYDNFVRKYMEE